MPSPCTHLVFDRPPEVSPARWMDTWRSVCGLRMVPDLRLFWISPDQCRLSIQSRAGEVDLGLADNLQAVARVLASWADVADVPAAPHPREMVTA